MIATQNQEVREALEHLLVSDASGINHDDIYGPGDLAKCHRVLANAYRDLAGHPDKLASLIAAAPPNSRIRPLIEGKENRGGTNPPNLSSRRPPPPTGSNPKPASKNKNIFSKYEERPNEVP